MGRRFRESMQIIIPHLGITEDAKTTMSVSRIKLNVPDGASIDSRRIKRVIRKFVADNLERKIDPISLRLIMRHRVMPLYS